MASMAVGAALPLLAKTGADIRPTRFKPIELSGLEPRPDFWKVRPQEIIDICERATKCSRKEIIARTPLGYPVYALFYGDFPDAPPQTNWSAGASSTTWKNYMGNPPPAKQTFLLLAGVHGAVVPKFGVGGVDFLGHAFIAEGQFFVDFHQVALVSVHGGVREHVLAGGNAAPEEINGLLYGVVGGIDFVYRLWSELFAPAVDDHCLPVVDHKEEVQQIGETDEVVLTGKHQFACSIGSHYTELSVVDDNNWHIGIHMDAAVGVGNLVEDGRDEHGAVEVLDAFLAVLLDDDGEPVAAIDEVISCLRCLIPFTFVVYGIE